MSTPCEKSEVIEMIREDLVEIKADVKSLLKYKWTIAGSAGVIGVIASFLISMFFK